MISQGDGSRAARSAFQVEFVGLGASFACRADQSLLAAMIASGHRLLAVGCRSGGCGVCRVRILSGTVSTGHMSRAIVSHADKLAGIVLACRAYPSSDIQMAPHPISGRGAGPIGQAA